MLIGKVVGSVVSTRKSENLVGNKFMIVDVLEHMQTGAKQIIAINKSTRESANLYWLRREAPRESVSECRMRLSMQRS